MKQYRVSHLVKSEDLNHHGTLFAGRSAEWLVEAAFIAAAAEIGKPENVVCLNIHGFTFKKPVQKGEIVTLKSIVVKAGNTSLTVHVEVYSTINGTSYVEGFLTFVNVEEKTGKKLSHGIVLDETEDEKESRLRKKAQEL